MKRLAAIFTRLVPVLGLCMLAVTTSRSAVYAGHLITQGLKGEGKEGAFSWTMTWAIDEAAFRLEARRGDETKYFVFNGKVFYVCGKLDAKQLAFLKSLKIDSKEILTKLAAGACQELPTNFSIKFFLSPYHALAALDLQGGLGSSLAVHDVKTELTGSVAEAAGNKCVNLKYSYALADAKRPSYSEAYSGSPCSAPPIKWRPMFARQLAMALIRSPGGQPSAQAVNSLAKSMPGLALSDQGEAASKDGSGSPVLTKVDVATESAVVQSLTPSQVGIPAGFDVIDPKALATLANVQAGPKSVQSGERSETPVDAIVKFLILGGNPAAAATGLLQPDEGKKRKE